MRRPAALLGVGLVLGTTNLLGSAAFAHANYASSSPAANARLAAPPDKIAVAFSEAADPKQSGLELIAADGRSVTSGGTPLGADQLVLPVPALSDGPYTVLWHTVSAVDGDAAHGFFVFQVGPDKPATTAIHRTGDASGVHVTFDITPGRLGANDYRATVTDGTNPLSNVLRVRLRIERTDRDIGAAFADLAPAAGAYTGSTLDLAFAGGYKLTVEVRRRDILDDLKFAFDVVVPAAAVATPPASIGVTSSPSGTAPSSAQPASGPGVIPWVVGWAVLILVGALALRAVRRR